MERVLSNKDMDDLTSNVSDVVVHGNPGLWICMCKASSQREGWMKSTKVMEVGALGCLVQVTTEIHGEVAEAVTFVPGAVLADFGLNVHDVKPPR